MKKILVAAILGLSAIGSTFAQGVLQFNNYAISPYNQVYWNNTSAGISTANTAVQNANVQIQIWYGIGTISDANLLTQGATTTISFDSAAMAYTPAGSTYGPGGFFNVVNQTINGWTSGATVTFQLRAAGTQGGNTFTGSSALWQESSQIVSSALPANLANFTPTLGVTVVPVPEPSTFALAGLGSAALLIFRRRK